MGSLKDEAFEKLDYLSQLTEIVIAPQNEILAQLPDRMELTFEQIQTMKSPDWGQGYGFQLRADHILNSLTPELEASDINELSQYFVIEATPETTIDLVAKTLTGSIALVKTIQRLEDKQILELAVKDAASMLRSYDWGGKRLRDKIITVLNTFIPGHGTEWALQANSNNGRITYQGRDALEKVIRDVILENKWRIRDVKIIAKLGEWVNSYLADASDTDLGLVNLVKLKIMLDKDLPVYSVDEVKNGKPA